MSNSNYKLELNESEYKVLLESLLYSFSIDVFASWYDQDYENMKKVLLKLRSNAPHILTESTKVESGLFRDNEDDDILKFFPEIITQKAIL